MTAISPDRFDEFFHAVHGVEPYPWQQRLAKMAAAGDWPDQIDLPTGAGKTACIDIALFALACQADRPAGERTAPVRIYFCVNRRVVVDEAYGRAGRIAERLAEAERGEAAPGVLRDVAGALRRVAATDPRTAGAPPVDVIEARGGIYRDNRWARTPLQPTVVCSTVDQLGSRLLFRAYGASPQAAPIQAALVAYDSLILLDEAHISRPFLRTLRAASRFASGWCERPLPVRPVRVVGMSATHADRSSDEGDVFALTGGDRKVERLRSRLEASKPAELMLVPKNAVEQKAVDQVKRALAEQPVAIGVMVNRVATAREIYRRLHRDDDVRKSCDGGALELVIGAMRPLDRDEQAARLRCLVGPDRPERTERTTVVVATQCLEVGADYDFDVLITECASLDALRQRFGRLNRAGRPCASRGVILIGKDQVKPPEKMDDSKPLDPIYGNALARTWHWLTDQAGDDGTIDFGVAPMDAAVEAIGDELEALLAPAARLDAPRMFPAYLDAWVQTSPRPDPEPDVSLFLHGPRPVDADVQVCWRLDLTGASDAIARATWPDTIALLPPTAAECMSVPISRLRGWLTVPPAGESAGDAPVEEFGDVLGVPVDTPQRAAPGAAPAIRRPAVVWRGRNGSFLVDSLDEIRPGDTIVLPLPPVTGDEGRAAQVTAELEALGHVPESATTTRQDHDLGEEAFRVARRKIALRLHPALRHRWPPTSMVADLLARLESDDQVPSDGEWPDLLREIAADPETSAQLRTTIDDLLEAGIVVRPYPDRRGVVFSSRGRVAPGAGTVAADLSPSVAMDEGDDETSAVGRRVPVRLDGHTKHVLESLRRFLGGLPLDALRRELEAAAILHDLGKADERFQAMLTGADRTLAWLVRTGAGAPLAKSANVPATPSEWRAVRARSGVPQGFRHEMLSVQLAESGALMSLLRGEGTAERDVDLVLDLVATHHGYARPFAPVVSDEEPPPVRVELAIDDPGGKVALMTELSEQQRAAWQACRIDSGLAERFWRVVRRYGWWGSAYLEAVLRLADQEASAREDAGEYEAHGAAAGEMTG